ncbi:hypothetical protein E2C01_051414 [Portunus trituberculatus]|uniref:Uncharacterized protein n=1 Tax=Portunus trituberculatus TaxID=210409 RepID=A0A5B7GLR1_PORTR|nr:hypothetical protein [Portunus trituberculatus]
MVVPSPHLLSLSQHTITVTAAHSRSCGLTVYNFQLSRQFLVYTRNFFSLSRGVCLLFHSSFAVIHVIFAALTGCAAQTKGARAETCALRRSWRRRGNVETLNPERNGRLDGERKGGKVGGRDEGKYTGRRRRRRTERMDVIGAGQLIWSYQGLPTPGKPPWVLYALPLTAHTGEERCPGAASNQTGCAGQVTNQFYINSFKNSPRTQQGDNRGNNR